jgi:hypothetical protein
MLVIGDVSPKHCVGVLADLTADSWKSKNPINRGDVGENTSAKGRLFGKSYQPLVAATSQWVEHSKIISKIVFLKIPQLLKISSEKERE